jgi:hypothetical protein
MRAEQGCQTGLFTFKELLGKQLRGFLIECGGGFIEQQDAGWADQPQKQTQFQTHAAGKTVRKLILHLPEPEIAQEGFSPDLEALQGIICRGDEAQVFPGGQLKVKTRDIRNKDEVAAGFQLLFDHVKAANLNRSGCWRDEVAEAIEQGGLPAAVMPLQNDNFTWIYGKVQGRDSLKILEFATQIAGFEDGFCRIHLNDLRFLEWLGIFRKRQRDRAGT